MAIYVSKPKKGNNRKIICCTFADNVIEYGQIIPGLALGYDPADKTWFLSTDHHKDVIFTIKPILDPFYEADIAEEKGLSEVTIEKINDKLGKSISNKKFEAWLEIINTVEKETKFHQRTYLFVYEMARKNGYELMKHGEFNFWLFQRSARLLNNKYYRNRKMQ